MRRQKSWGFSVLKRARDEKRIAPFYLPLPQSGHRMWPRPLGRGPDGFAGAWGCSPGSLQNGRGRRLASALQEGREEGGSAGGGLEVEGRRAAHRYVRSLIIVINCKYCPCLNLAKKERVWICQPRTACKRAEMKVGRRARDGKIRPGANSNPAADASPAPRPDQPSRPEFRGKGAADLPKPPAPCTPTAPRPPLPGWPPRTSREAQPRAPTPTGGSPSPRDQNADCSQYPQSSTVNLQIPSAENYPLQRVAEQQSKSLILSSFNQPPERGRTLGPSNPQKHLPLVTVSPTAPEL